MGNLDPLIRHVAVDHTIFHGEFLEDMGHCSFSVRDSEYLLPAV